MKSSACDSPLGLLWLQHSLCNCDHKHSQPMGKKTFVMTQKKWVRNTLFWLNFYINEKIKEAEVVPKNYINFYFFLKNNFLDAPITN
jgi:hypothetical protein